MRLEAEKQPVAKSVVSVNGNPARRLRVGYVVFGLLVVIKIVEYLVATTISAGNWPFLAILAGMSAWLIVYYYKHISQLWHAEDEDE